MGSNSLGSLTVDLIANTGGFVGPIEQSERVALKAMKAIGAAVDEFGNYTDKTYKKIAQSSAALDSSYDRIAENMKREIALYGDVTRAATVAYDVQKGALKGLSDEQKRSLTAQAMRLDALDNANAAFNKNAKAIDQAGGSLRGFRGIAQSAGYQLQDIAVQAQAGTSAFTIFSQQGSQFASSFGAGGAVVGAVIALSGVIGGVLFRSFMDTAEAIKKEADNIKVLTGNIRDLTDAEREHVNAGSIDRVNEQIKKNNELSETIKKQIANIKLLNEQNGQTRTVTTSYGGGSAGSIQVIIDNTKALLDAQKDLTANQLAFDAANKAIDEGRDVEGVKKRLQALKDETALVGLHGDALWRQKGIQAGLTEENLKAYELEAKRFDSATTAEYIKGLNDETLALQLRNAEIHKNIPLMAELAKKQAESKAGKQGGTPEQQAEIVAAGELNTKLKEKNDLDTKAVALYEQQDKSAKDRILSLEREVALYGVSSKAQQLEYDIKSGLIKINGGLLSQQAKRMLQLTAELELMDKQAALAKAAEAVAFAGYDNTKGNIESAKMQYELDNGILKINGALTKEYYEQLIANKKIEESKNNIKNIDDYLKGQTHEIDKARLITGEEKLRYDIMNNILYIEGGITSEKAKQALSNQRIRDAQVRQLQLADAIKSGLTEALLQSSMEGEDIFKTLAKSIKGIFSTLVLKPILDIATDQISKQLSGILGSVGTKGADGKVTGATGALGSLGPWGAVAAAVVAGVSIYNKEEEKKFAKLDAAYRQGTQSLGTVLGQANTKSDSISSALERLGETSDTTLGVNRNMYQALLDIKTGISGAAAGFARQMSPAGLSALESSSTLSNRTVKAIGGSGLALTNLQDKVGGNQLTSFVAGFTNALAGKIASAVYSNKTKVTDSGIKIMGTALSDILASGTIEAFNYATLKTTKKFIGLSYSTKVKEQTSAVDEMFEKQFASIFLGAGEALEIAAGVFNQKFDPSKLLVDTQNLSLKGLEGDALTKEIESFFSSTLDNWAGVLVGGTTILKDFQQVGEGAFETVVRLASQTTTFSEYAKLLNLNFKATGIAAVIATQNIAEAAGGFDKLSESLASYYQNFYTDAERASKATELLAAQFKDLGYDTLPSSREAFRSLVEGIDVTTESGAALFASVIGLSGQFAELVKWTDSANLSTEQLIKTLKDAASTAFDNLSRSIEAERTRIEGIVDNASGAKGALDAAISREKETVTASHNERLKLLQEAAKKEQELAQSSADAEYESRKAANRAQQDLFKEQISEFEKSISGLSKLFDDLNSAISDIAIVTDDVTRARRRAAEYEIETAITNARAGRGVPTDGRLNDALSTLRNNPTQLYSSLEEMSYATAVTQNKLKELADLTENQMTTEQQTLVLLQQQLEAAQLAADAIQKSTVAISEKFDEQIAAEDEAYTKQIATLDAMAEDARKQFDKLTGIDTSLLSLDEAQKAFNTALLAADFVNAKAQLDQLTLIESNAKAQLDTLLGIETGIMSVEDALREFASALVAVKEATTDGGLGQSKSSLQKSYDALVEETTALRQESYDLNQETRKNTQETADILRRMEEESLTI